MSTDDVVRASRLLDNEIRILKVKISPYLFHRSWLFLVLEYRYIVWIWFGVKEELQRTNLELESFKEKIKENQEKIKLNKQLPYLVGNIVEVIIVCYLLKKNFKFFLVRAGCWAKSDLDLWKHVRNWQITCTNQLEHSFEARKFWNKSKQSTTWLQIRMRSRVSRLKFVW